MFFKDNVKLYHIYFKHIQLIFKLYFIHIAFDIFREALNDLRGGVGNIEKMNMSK